MESVEKVAETVLYEGYLLYPYRRSSIKNQMRWTFGGVYPRIYSEATGGDDPWLMQTQCLVEGDADAQIEVKVIFLQVVDRRIMERTDCGEREAESLRVGDCVYKPWEEAIERELIATYRVGDLIGNSKRMEIAIDAGISEESLLDSDGIARGAVIREWQGVHGEAEISAQSLGDLGYRVTVKITNDTPFDGAERAAVVRRSFISTHTILRITDGQFVSLLEPPEAYEDAAKACENIRTWPVMAGEQGERHTMLSSPIILYDYPAVSPESPGDLFDGTEIDELLRFSILTLTDEEKQEMRESDERGREILARTEAMTPEQLMKLHASVRSIQSIRNPEL